MLKPFDNWKAWAALVGGAGTLVVGLWPPQPTWPGVWSADQFRPTLGPWALSLCLVGLTALLGLLIPLLKRFNADFRGPPNLPE